MLFHNIGGMVREERGEPDAGLKIPSGGLADDGGQTVGKDFRTHLRPVAPDTVSVVDLQKTGGRGEFSQFLQIFADGTVGKFCRIVVPRSPARPVTEIEIPDKPSRGEIGIGVKQFPLAVSPQEKQLLQRTGFSGFERPAVAVETSRQAVAFHQEFPRKDPPGCDRRQQEISFPETEKDQCSRIQRIPEIGKCKFLHGVAHLDGSGQQNGLRSQHAGKIKHKIDPRECGVFSGPDNFRLDRIQAPRQTNRPPFRHRSQTKLHTPLSSPVFLFSG